MIRYIVILVFVIPATFEMQSMEYEMHVTRKSRSNSAPVESGYLYSKLNDNPGTLATFGNSATSSTSQVGEPYATLLVSNNSEETYRNYDTSSAKNNNSDSYVHKTKIFNKTPTISDSIQNSIQKHFGPQSKVLGGIHNNKIMNNFPSIVDSHLQQLSYNHPSKRSSHSETDDVHTVSNHQTAPYSVDYEIAKSEAKYDSKFMPAKIKADIEIEKIKSAMHYRPESDVFYDMAYNSFNSFHLDDDDVRTSSRSPYDSWPYFYHSPYEYEHNKISADLSYQKAIDKRYAVDTDTNRKIIPVHERPEYDTPYNAPYVETTTVDNPISGHQPFFSFVLNDYFDKNSGEDDSLNFKGLDWGQDFDYGHDRTNIDEIINQRRPSRQGNYESYEDSDHILNNDHNTKAYDVLESISGDSSTEKGYTKSKEFVKEEEGDESTSDDHKAYEKKDQNQKKFKKFVDTFANKFGGEDHKRNSKYSLQRNQDKGEKKKGFRRVYHKDEYQEDNEFYDNTNNKAHVHEDANSSSHAGGSEAFLKSDASAASGDKSNSHSKKGNAHKSNFHKNHRGNDKSMGNDNDFNRYREEAKKAARINNADYLDYSTFN